MKNSDFNIYLLNPPVDDFTMPSLALPTLKAHLKNEGIKSTVIDLNLQLFTYLLSKENLDNTHKFTKDEITKYFLKKELCFEEAHVLYNYLIKNKTIKHHNNIDFSLLRKKEVFSNPNRYQSITKTVDDVMQLISSTIHPFSVTTSSFLSHAHSFRSSVDIEKAIKDFDKLQFNPISSLINYSLNKLNRNKNCIIGISLKYSAQLFFTLYLVYKIKKIFKHATIVVGGPFATYLYNGYHHPLYSKDTLLHKIDYIVLGDGEIPFTKLVNKIINRKTNFSIEGVHNTSHYQPGKQCKVYLSNEFTLPNYDDLDLSSYFSPKTVLPIAPVKGCPWGRCTFCCYGYGQQSRKSTRPYLECDVSTFIEQIVYLKNKYNTHHFNFVSDSIHPTHLSEIASALIKSNAKIKYFSELRITNKYNKEQISLLRKSGLSYVTLGIESTSEPILKLMNKGYKNADISKFVESFSEEKIDINCMYILNFPGETFDDAMSTLSFIKKHSNHTLGPGSISNFKLLKGSYIFNNAANFGINNIHYPENDMFLLDERYSYKDKKSPKENTFITKKFNNSFKETRQRPWYPSCYSTHSFLIACYGTYRNINSNTIIKNNGDIRSPFPLNKLRDYSIYVLLHKNIDFKKLNKRLPTIKRNKQP